MNLFDLRVPFFRPVWRRAAVVAVALGWAIFELATGSVFWAILFAALGFYAAYEFFVVFDPADYGDKPEDKR